MNIANLDRILPLVSRPARYTDGEWNRVVKDWGEVSVRVALIYPDVYEIGMSNLGLSIIYEVINAQRDMAAERAFAPWVDMEYEMRRRSIPLFSLESRRPLRQFDIVAFSLGYELTYTNVLNILDLAQIPLLASERGEDVPLVIAGGSCTLNPEPMADFIDLFVIGEGEEVVPELLGMFRDWKREGGTKGDFLREAAKLSGIYVPRFYDASYQQDGRLRELRPIVAEAAARIVRRLVDPLPPPVTRPVVPYIETVHDRATLEIQRGCTRGCRFCQAGVIYRPSRQRPQEEVLAAASELLQNTGYSDLSLLALSPTDYDGIAELVGELSSQHSDDPAFSISLPSQRMDSFSLALAEALPGRPRGGFTFAPEAGTERLRLVVNKPISDADLLETCSLVFGKGWTNLKLYFIVGLPTETEDDIQGIVSTVQRMQEIGRKVAGRRPRLRVSTTAFIPKPHTAFQWVAQATTEELEAKNEALRRGIRGRGVSFSWQNPTVALLEAVLSRGDRRLGQVIHAAWRRGCRFDAWSEHLELQRWMAAFEEVGLDPNFYAQRQRDMSEVLPWAHIDTGVSLSFLWQEYQRSVQGQETPDCRLGLCSACGLETWNSRCRRKLQEPLTIADGP